MTVTPPLVVAGTRVTADRTLRRLDGGRVLLGGSPLRMWRLDARGADVAAHVLRGEPCTDPAARALARRLLDAGMAQPVPTPGPATDEVTVVVPIRDRAEELAACLAAVGPCAAVLVVDDGSRDAEAITTVAARHGATVVRRHRSGGPGVARNAGLAQVATPYVAFLDSDCRPEPGWLDRLLPHLSDPAVAVVAPRITAVAVRSGWLSGYEQARSPLDLGDEPARVAPLTRVSYVPSAALLARVSALGAGFDPAMRFGEDVDLIWRLVARGQTVRYEPGAVVRHLVRPTWRAWARQRYEYGTSAAALEQRHPGTVPAALLHPWSLGAWALLVAGRPRTALTVTVLAAERLRHQLPLEQDRWRESARLAGVGTLRAGRLLASAATRTWWPVLLPLVPASRTARRTLLAAALLPPLAEWVRRQPPLDPARFAAAHVADDVAYSLGVWAGCLRSGVVAPLLPAPPRATRVQP